MNHQPPGRPEDLRRNPPQEPTEDEEQTPTDQDLEDIPEPVRALTEILRHPPPSRITPERRKAIIAAAAKQLEREQEQSRGVDTPRAVTVDDPTQAPLQEDGSLHDSASPPELAAQGFAAVEAEHARAPKKDDESTSPKNSS